MTRNYKKTPQDMRGWTVLRNINYLYLFSSETESFFLPFPLLLAKTFLPFGDDILSLNPCLFLLFLTDG